MPGWKSILLGLLSLTGSSLSCAHHDDGDVVPEHEREELLKKWDQEVRSHIRPWINYIPSANDIRSGHSPESPASPI